MNNEKTLRKKQKENSQKGNGQPEVQGRKHEVEVGQEYAIGGLVGTVFVLSVGISKTFSQVFM